MISENQYWESWGAFIDWSKRSGIGEGITNPRSRYIGDNRWFGTPNWTRALELAENGWREGLQSAAQITEPLVTKVSSLLEVPHVVYAEEGMTVDVARYLDGEPECFQQMHWATEQQAGVKHLKILVNVAVSSGIDTAVITAKGATIAALVELLELSGARVDLTVCSPCTNSPLSTTHSVHTEVHLKKPDQPLDLGRTIFALAHPSMNRRLMFNAWEHLKNHELRRALSVPGHYGYPSDALPENRAEYDLYFGRTFLGEPQWTDPKAAQQWVLEQLKAQGVQVREI